MSLCDYLGKVFYGLKKFYIALYFLFSQNLFTLIFFVITDIFERLYS